jgi:hypothetical protein
MLKTMDPELIHKLLEGAEDILTPEVKAEETLYRNTRCPVCGHGECEKRIPAPKVVAGENGELVVAVSPFGADVLPDGYAHCIHCDTDFNPYTGMIFHTEASMIHAPE